MALPFILGAAAAAAGLIGAGAAIDGLAKVSDANDTMKKIEQQHKDNIENFEQAQKSATLSMDMVGKKELEILDTFDEFSDLIEKIQNRPEFKTYNRSDVNIPEYNPEELKKVAIGAGVLLGGLGGAAMGTAGGFAAAGATTSAVMALGTASTGTAIASLSGVAATNATLAALGGGALAAGGGGMALGSTILGVTTLGAGILVGGLIFNAVGASLSDKADEARKQMLKAQEEMNKIKVYLSDLETNAKKFYNMLLTVDSKYQLYFGSLRYMVEVEKKTDWNQLTQGEKLCVENSVLLVGLLYNMCKVQLVLKDKDSDELNEVNVAEIEKTIANTTKALTQIA